LARLPQALRADVRLGREFLRETLRHIRVAAEQYRPRRCPLCQQQLGKLTPQHMRRHGLTLPDAYRKFAGLAFNRGARLLIQPSPDGLLNTGKVFGLVVAGAGFEPATFDGMKALRLRPRSDYRGRWTTLDGVRHERRRSTWNISRSMPTNITPWRRSPGRTASSSANNASHSSAARSSTFSSAVSGAPRWRSRPWAIGIGSSTRSRPPGASPGSCTRARRTS